MNDGTIFTIMAGAISTLFGLLIKTLMDRAAEYKADRDKAVAERDKAVTELKSQNTTLAELVAIIKKMPPGGKS